MAIKLRMQNAKFQIVGHRQPRDGALYIEDLRVIFPEKVRAKVQVETVEAHNQRV